MVRVLKERGSLLHCLCPEDGIIMTPQAKRSSQAPAGHGSEESREVRKHMLESLAKKHMLFSKPPTD